MNIIFTIGFTKKTAQVFFGLLKSNKVKTVLDVRLNNTSQLAGFSKYPDIEFFLNEICNINYINDTKFAPTEKILKDFKNKKISWDNYVLEFNKVMDLRKIDDYIKIKYKDYAYDNICLLCSEEKYSNCHRSLVARHFCDVLGGNIVHL